MGKLYVSRRDAKDAKKALEDSDEITKLPKMVMEVYEIGTPEYRQHTQSITPGQDITDYQRFKVQSMKEALAKVWGLDEAKKEEKDLTNELKGGKTMTGKKANEVDVKPEIKDK